MGNVSAGHPCTYRRVTITMQTMLLSHQAILLFRELVRQQVQKVLRPRLSLDFHLLAKFLFQLPTEIEHLAPEIILLCPPYEISDLLAPFVAMSYVEHHSLQPGNHVGTIGKDTVGFTFIELCNIAVLTFDVESQLLCLRALYQAVGRIQTLNIRFQFLSELVVVDALDRPRQPFPSTSLSSEPRSRQRL